MSAASALAELKGELDLRRKQYILAGGVSDMKNHCVLVPDLDYEVEKSIWGVMDEPIKAMIRQNARKPMWSDSAIARVARDFESIPRPLPESTELLDFMRDECDFRIEHADGSFMDHLTFCRDYGAAHYKQQSPTPLLLHSILGVGTNIFPMDKSKIPRLQQLVSRPDFAQIQAFPSILRLVSDLELLDALAEVLERGQRLSGVSFHRLIDNAPLRLSTDELWTQLNFHLIHLMDFLPVANWGAPESLASGQFQVFARLLSLLTQAQRLEAKVVWDASDGGASLRDLVAGMLPGQAEGRAFVRGFQHERSEKIGHSLDFKLELAANL